MLACIEGEESLAKMLLPLSDPRASDRDGETALMLASFGHPACVELLLPVSDPHGEERGRLDRPDVGRFQRQRAASNSWCPIAMQAPPSWDWAGSCAPGPRRLAIHQAARLQ
jgi:hypothetical protein